MTWKCIAAAGLVAGLALAGCANSTRTEVGSSGPTSTAATPTTLAPVPPQPGRVHLTLSQSCPASDSTVHGVSNPGVETSGADLLAAGTPSRILLCQYYGLNGERFALWKTSTLVGTAAADFGRQVAALRPAAHTGPVATNCPMDDGSATIAAVGYPSGRVVDLWITMRGCASISNGTTTVPNPGTLGLSAPPIAG